VLASPACLALAGAVDGAVVVMEAAATSWRATQDAVDVLQSSGIAPLGLVLNKVRPDLPRRWSRRLGEPVASGEAG
jgi:Mrp family chromosome partitioning ATPase